MVKYSLHPPRLKYRPDKVALIDLDEAWRALELQIETLLFFVDVEVVQVVAGGCEVHLVAGKQVGEEALHVKEQYLKFA